MKEYIAAIIIFLIGLVMIITGTLVSALNWNNLMNIFGGISQYVQFIILYSIVSLAFIVVSILMYKKTRDNNAKLNRLDMYGERVLGVVKNVTLNPKMNELAKVDVECILSSKGTKHVFSSDWFDFTKFHLSKGVKVYVIYDKKNLDNYSVVYNKIIRD